jgi:DNA-directed RNA polymerase sigma subunit (sigma70/sigma32)
VVYAKVGIEGAMKDFRVSITVKNNLLLSAIEDAGYDSVASFVRAFGMNYSTVNKYLGLKASPIGRDGAINTSADLLCDALGKNLHEIFPERFMARCLERNTLTMEMDEGELARAITGPNTAAQKVIESETRGAIDRALATLPDRTRRALVRHYGLDGEPSGTLEENGKKFGVTGARFRVIVQTGERLLRHPSRSNPLAEAVLDKKTGR